MARFPVPIPRNIGPPPLQTPWPRLLFHHWRPLHWAAGYTPPTAAAYPGRRHITPRLEPRITNGDTTATLIGVDRFRLTCSKPSTSSQRRHRCGRPLLSQVMALPAQGFIAAPPPPPGRPTLQPEDSERGIIAAAPGQQITVADATRGQQTRHNRRRDPRTANAASSPPLWEQQPQPEERERGILAAAREHERSSITGPTTYHRSKGVTTLVFCCGIPPASVRSFGLLKGGDVVDRRAEPWIRRSSCAAAGRHPGIDTALTHTITPQLSDVR
uniref:Uncharacterized protein n=1 Tax=Anopheles merus TaxID=30066 RepID=A0A182V721_ANOME